MNRIALRSASHVSGMTFGPLPLSRQEGFRGSQLSNRLGVLEKRWISRKGQAELDIASQLSILCADKLANRRAELGPRVRTPALLASAA